MNYRSTRDTSSSPITVSSAEAIKKGLAPDGGLYMPDMIPRLSSDDIASLRPLSYAERAAFVLSLFLTDYDKDALLADCKEA